MKLKTTKIFGLHSVQAALLYTPEKIAKAWIDGSGREQRLLKLLDSLNDLGIAVEKTERKSLDRLTGGTVHQGVVIDVSLPGVLGENELKKAVAETVHNALWLVLDQVQDPHNLGACLRTAEAAGAHGVIIPKDNSAAITPTVYKVASGAAETLPVYQVTNLARILRWLKDQGIWIFGSTDVAETSFYQNNFSLPLALVIGAEGKGMRRLTREQCDFLIKIPMLGHVESLNLSVATGVVLYEIVRQRLLQDGR
jgi:23S rRNA (guanosine2251-2'-O)-methyltransferase